MKRSAHFLALTCSISGSISAATFNWTAPSSIASGTGYNVAVDCWPTYPQDPGLGATLFKNGSFFADNYSFSGPNVVVDGYTSDFGAQSIEYSVDLYVYDGLYFDDSGYHGVTVMGSNHPPLPSVEVDGYANGATIVRPRNESISITVRYKATDTGGDLTGIRFRASGPNGWTNTDVVAQSGSTGEVVRNYTLNENGSWYFKAQAWDASNSPNEFSSGWFILKTTEAANDAVLLAQSIPSAVYKGTTFAVSQTWRNSGTNIWAPSTEHRLGTQNPEDNTTWGAGRWNLPYNVDPSSDITLPMSLTAPDVSGTHNFQTRMVMENVEWFGAYSPNVVINVANRPTVTSTVSPDSITLGESVGIRATYLSDLSHGDPILETRVDVRDPNGNVAASINGGAGGSIDYRLTPTMVGDYTYSAYLRTALTPAWTSYSTGAINVFQHAITVEAPSGSKVYDGRGATLGSPAITSGTLQPGHRLSFTGNTQNIPASVGVVTTLVGSITIRSISGVDVTAAYNITTINGTYSIDEWTPPAASEVGSLPVTTTVDNGGGANLSIPLATPPGRGGMQPSLTLNYSSNNGNGPLGVGWSVSTGFPEAITRGRSILARDGYVDGVNHGPNDRLYLDGKRLILTAPAGGAYWAVGNEYRTEVDSFAKIIALGANGATTGTTIEAFKVVKADGTILYFGNTDNNASDAVWNVFNSSIAYYSWSLKRAVDSLGNTVDFSYNVYKRDDGRVTGEHLLAELKYTANPSAGVAPAFGVKFLYTPGGPTAAAGERERGDVYSGYIARGAWEMRRRLERIDAGPLVGGEVISIAKYDISYGESPSTGRSRLMAISASRKKDLASDFISIPPTVFTYNDDGSAAPLEVPQYPSSSPAGSTVLFVPENQLKIATGDFNGDGLTDKYFAGKVYLGNGAGFSDGTQWIPTSTPPAGVIRAGDVNGDGLSDIICVTHAQIYVALSTGTAFGSVYNACDLGAGVSFDSDVFWEYESASSSRVSVGDFNGDGRTDVLIHCSNRSVPTYAGLYVCVSNGVTFSAPDRWGAVQDIFCKYWSGTPGYPLDWERLPSITSIEPTVADFNNDGKDDYVYIRRDVAFTSNLVVYSTYLKVAINTSGTGTYRLDPLDLTWWDKTVGISEMQSTDAPLLKVLVGDCNGDGYKDLLVLSERAVSPGVRVPKWCLWANKGGSFADPIEDYMPQTDPTSGMPNHNIDRLLAYDNMLYFWAGNQIQTGGMFLHDVNADGRADFVYGRGDDGGWLIKYAQKDGFGPSESLWGNSEGGFGDVWGDYTPYFGTAGEGGVSLELIELNGDGAADWLLTDMGTWGGNYPLFAKGSNAKADRLEAFVDGFGRITHIAYKPTTDSAIYTPGATVTYPIREVINPQLVVSDIWKDYSINSLSEREHFSYQYSGARTDLSGRGRLGFHAFITLDHQTNLFKYQFLTQSFPMTGLTAREQTYRFWESGGNVNFRLVSSHDNTVVFDEVVNGANTSEAYGTVYPFISKATESRWENSDTAHFSFPSAGSASTKPELLFPKARPSGAHITITAESWFDEQNQSEAPPSSLPGSYKPRDRTTDWSEAGSNVVTGILNFADFEALDFPRKITYGNLRRLKTDFGDGFKETVTTTYKPVTSSGLTGLVDKVTTTVESSAFGVETAPTKSYTYWSNDATPTPLVHTETVDSADDRLDLTTTYNRDTLGRVTSTEISGSEIGSYTISSATEFDSRFDRPTLFKNAYDHPATAIYHEFVGVPTSITDVNDAETTTNYDALGRIIQVRDVLKNLQTDTHYKWDYTQTVSPPSGVTGLTLTSVYRVRVSTTAQPKVTTYYDRLSRPIRSVKEGYAGQSTVTDTVYNALGQVVAVSLPYKSGATPVFWTKTTYDVLGRVKTVEAPNGTLTTNTYNGRVTQVTVAADDRDPQTNTTYVDAKGRTIKVWNADNVPSSVDPVTGSSTTASLHFKLDGFGRMRETVLKDQTQTITAKYDALGRQTELSDPDNGKWVYVNNALGQVVKQTDAKQNVTSSVFDRLGRQLSRTITEANGGPVESSAWYYYDTETDNSRHLVAKGTQGWVGALQRDESQTVSTSAYFGTATSTIRYYNDKGLPSLNLSTIDNKWFYSWTNYDTYSRVAHVRHYWRPAGQEEPSSSPYTWEEFGYTNNYDSQSYLLSVVDTANRTWWQADDVDGYDHLDRPVHFRKGSAYWTTRTYGANDGLLIGIQTGDGDAVQNLSFSYDGLGNLKGRNDGVRSLAETYGYDSLNRLTKRNDANIAGYLGNGNIDWKKDVSGTSSGTYTYNHPVKPHAVTSAWGYTMAYDENGNLQTRTGGGHTWATKWAGFDKPRWLAKDGVGSEFHYNADHSRVMHLEFDQMAGGEASHYVRKKIYAAGPAVEIDYKNSSSTGASWAMDTVRVYIPGPDGTAGTRDFSPAAPPGQQEKLFAYHYDHLGSIDTITPYADTSANPSFDDDSRPTRYSYDAWGQRRNADTWSGAPVNTARGGAKDVTPRGYTGHEMLDDLGLVHMNGRIYDPLLGRFLSADTVVQVPGSLQSYNRYSYVHNNPLSFTDPTGESAPEVIVIGGGIIVAGGAVAIMSTTPEGRKAAADLSNSVVNAVSQAKGANLEQKAQIGAMVAVLKIVSWFKGTAEHRTDANAVANPQTGDKGKIANTQSNMEASKDKPATSTASPAPQTPKAEEGFTASPSGATQSETPAANPADTPTTTGTPVPTADVPLKTDAKGDGSGVIYVVPGEATPSNKDYVGRTSNPAGPVGRGNTDGRDRSKAKVVDTYSTTREGKTKEQQNMDQRGGVDKLDNKRNEIDPKKRKEYGLD